MASQAHGSTDALTRARVASLLKWFSGVNSGDLDAALSGFAEDVTWFGIDPALKRKTWHGRPAVRDYLAGLQGTDDDPGSFPKLYYDVLHIASVDDTVMIEWKNRARLAGNSYENQGVMVADYAPGGEKVTAIRSFFDFTPMSEQDIRWREQLSNIEQKQVK